MNSPLGTGRRILSVVGPHSGCGKTTLVLYLLRHIGGFGCLKISPAREPPRAAPDGAFDTETGFYFECDEDRAAPCKDTAAYRAAGALHVERLRYWRSQIAAGLGVALDRFPRSMPIVVESSSAVKLMTPGAVVLVVRPPLREMKPSTRAILPRVTDLVINAPHPDDTAGREDELLRRAYPALQPLFTWTVDLRRPQGHETMLDRMRPLLSAADG